MLERENLVGLSMTMTVSSEQVLMILLAADGTINRLGTGTEDNESKTLHIGRVGSSVFEALREHIDPELDRWAGRFSDSEQQGKPCCLTIGLIDKSSQETVVQFEYGSESQGPPEEVCNLVVAAIELTDDWYDAQDGK